MTGEQYDVGPYEPVMPGRITGAEMLSLLIHHDQIWRQLTGPQRRVLETLLPGGWIPRAHPTVVRHLRAKGLLLPDGPMRLSPAGRALLDWHDGKPLRATT